MTEPVSVQIPVCRASRCTLTPCTLAGSERDFRWIRSLVGQSARCSILHVVCFRNVCVVFFIGFVWEGCSPSLHSLSVCEALRGVSLKGESLHSTYNYRDEYVSYLSNSPNKLRPKSVRYRYCVQHSSRIFLTEILPPPCCTCSLSRCK